jgi:hypothetical protein
MHAVSIPEIALAVYASVNQPTLFAAARVCRGWAPIALDVLWRHPPPAALLPTVVAAADRRALYAPSVRSLSLFTADEAEAAVHGWTFPRLRSLVLPCAAIERAPDACRAFLARCGGGGNRGVPPTLRCVYLTEHRRDTTMQFDGSYDACLTGLLADIAQRRGLEELLIDTAVSERLHVPIADFDTDNEMAAGSQAVLQSTSDLSTGRRNGDYAGTAVGAVAGRTGEHEPVAFRDLRRLYVQIVASGGDDAIFPPVSLLRAELLSAVTHLWLDLEWTSALVTSALDAVSRLSALHILRLSLPDTCRFSVANLVSLSRLAELRHLFIDGAYYGIGFTRFPDADWARLAAGLKRLRTIDFTMRMGLLRSALRILGSRCRELTDVKMIQHIEDLDSLRPLVTTTAASSVTTLSTTIVSEGGNAYDANGGVAVVFPELVSLTLARTWTGFDMPGANTTAATLEKASALCTRLRAHAPKLARFCVLDHSLLGRAMEEDMRAAGVGHNLMVGSTQMLGVVGKAYWDEVYTDRPEPAHEWYGCGMARKL